MTDYDVIVSHNTVDVRLDKCWFAHSLKSRWYLMFVKFDPVPECVCWSCCEENGAIVWWRHTEIPVVL